MESLGTEFPKEQARCRDLLKVYRGLGGVGAFGATMIEQVLRKADKAAAESDVVEMLRAFEEMKGCA